MPRITETRWFIDEDEDTWVLFREHPEGVHPYQILKAPKKDTPYAEYWPTEEEGRVIVAAAKMYEALNFPGDTSVLLDLAANIIEVRGHEAHQGIAKQLRKKAVLEREALALVDLGE